MNFDPGNLRQEEAKMIDLALVNQLIQSLKNRGISVKSLSDTYHTFQELYDFRLVYNAALFNHWARSIVDPFELVAPIEI